MKFRCNSNNHIADLQQKLSIFTVYRWISKRKKERKRYSYIGPGKNLKHVWHVHGQLLCQLWLAQSWLGQDEINKGTPQEPQEFGIIISHRVRIKARSNCQDSSHQDTMVKCHSSSHYPYRTSLNRPANSSHCCTGRSLCCQHGSPRLNRSRSPKGVAPHN